MIKPPLLAVLLLARNVVATSATNGITLAPGEPAATSESLGIPLFGSCGYPYTQECECPGKCTSIDPNRTICAFCPATPCPSTCTSTSSWAWICSGCFCPTTSTPCPTFTACGPGCTSTGVWQTVTRNDNGCSSCYCSFTPPSTPCPTLSCPRPCRPAPTCGLTGTPYFPSYAPGSSCPGCGCGHPYYCSALPCQGPCSTGTLQFVRDECNPCLACTCASVTACPGLPPDCTGPCEGGTLGISTISCLQTCSEFCMCKTTQMGLGGRDAPLTKAPPTPTLTGAFQGVEMTGVVIPKESILAHFQADKRHRAAQVTTTLVF